MPHLMAQYRIPRDSFVPEDVSINTWHFAWDNVAQPNPALAALAIATHLQNFYEAIDNYLSSKNANPTNIRVYNMDEPEPRAPMYNDSIGDLTYGSSFLPSEVAVCLSFQGVAISGLPQARRRGRVFLGPMADVQASATADGTVVLACRSAIADAAETLKLFTAGDDVTWSVYSVMNDNLVPVDNGWIDDAFDTIRSRGARATLRTVWS